MLYTKDYDRTKTQLSYAAQFLLHDLPEAARQLIVWRRKIMLRKGQLTQLLTEGKESLRYQLKPGTMPNIYKINWEYNAIPTEQEWERKSNGYIITVDLRIVKDVGPVAVLSFY